MIPHKILGLPIVERAAPSDFVPEEDRELYFQITDAINALRCPFCGSLNYETTVFVFSTGAEKSVECRNCGGVYEELLVDQPVVKSVVAETTWYVAVERPWDDDDDRDAN